MMTRKLRSLPLWLPSAVAGLLLSTTAPIYAQAAKAAVVAHATAKPDAAGAARPETAKAVPEKPIPAEAAKPKATSAAAPNLVPDRARAYYHAGLANIYEQDALNNDRPEEMTQAIAQFKMALAADPLSAELHLGLADLYFGTGDSAKAEATVRDLLKSAPDNLDAHRLLGRIYLRQLSQGENTPSAPAASGDMLDLAIGQFEKIVALDPTSVDDREVLGQLYTLKHEPKRAEAQFKAAQAAEPDSEDVVLNLARFYAAKGDTALEAKTIEAVPVDNRTARMELVLGAAYEQLKQNQDAITAYRRASEMDPDNPQIDDALGRVLLADNQLDAALAAYGKLLDADPGNAAALVHVGEIERRQGKYEDALATIQKALKSDPKNLEAGYNAGLLLDVLGRFDKAAEIDQKMVDLTSHANGAYTDDEKNNRSIFLERLGSVYQEQNKIPEAIAAFQKMIDMGGDSARRGYELEVDTYRGAQEYDQAVEAARQAVTAFPKNLDLKLMLAGELGDVGKSDEGVAMAKSLLTDKKDKRTVLMALAEMEIRAHQWKDAAKALDQAEPLTTKQDDRISLLFLRGELAERQKHDKPADRCFQQILQLDPTNALTLNYLGYTYADKGIRLPEALDMIRKAVKEDPMNGAYLDSLGWVYFKMGAYDLAEQNLTEAIARDRTDPTVHDHMGQLYEKTGRIREAAAMWELSLAEFAKTAPIDVDQAELARVRKRLDDVRVRLAREDSLLGLPKQ